MPYSEDLRYPIGPFVPPARSTDADRRERIASMRTLPDALRASLRGLTDANIETAYRPGGWTVRQVVHHVADSHINAYMRLKLALTEDRPTIRPYAEELWAELADVRGTPLETSLSLLDAVHKRLDGVLATLAAKSFAREYVHPTSGTHDVDYLLAMYAWHGAHHVAHILSLREREGWRTPG